MSALLKRHFWNWFRLHHQEYLSTYGGSQKEREYRFLEMLAHLKAYCRFFGFSFPDSGEQNILTITVAGKPKYFKHVDRFVAAAPEISGWKFKALEDPMPVDFLQQLRMEDTGIDAQELFFSFGNDHRGNTGIIVYHPLYTYEKERQFLELANSAVYYLLGERSFGLDIDYVDVANLSRAKTKNVLKLEELPGCIGSRRSSIIVDDQGRLSNKHCQ